ncbi:hypothetical protein Ruko_12080 [Ruthenibacterium sp. TH_2024_36131]|uniref:hypothetical protein n=1 Tax=Owariibacterium komagatae TaxID=3136601 RepID=UPI0038B23A1F
MKRYKRLDWKKILALPLFFEKYEKKTKNALKSVVLELLYLSPNQFDFIQKEKSDTLFFCASGYHRADHLKNFMKVYECCPCADALVGKNFVEHENPYAIHWKNLIRYLGKSVGWFVMAVKRGLKFSAFIHIWPNLIEIDSLIGIISELPLQRYKRLVVYFDGWPTDCFMVQLFKESGKVTYTLQHGTFARGIDNFKNTDEYGFELKVSTADFFLAWNKYTVQEAEVMGLDTYRFRILGMPKFIGVKQGDFHKKATRKFGVVLNWNANSQQNIALVKVANQIAGKIGFQYILKYHPTDKGIEYDAYVSKGLCRGVICGRTTTLEEYIEQVDFSIVGNSSMLLELLWMGSSIYHYFEPGQYDKYQSVAEISFSDINGFEDIFDLNAEDLNEIRSRICGPTNPEEQYKNFFEKECLS